MKICIINNLYKPYNRGGAERVVEIIIDGLQKAGHEVVIIATRPLKSECQLSDVNCQMFYLWNIISYYNLHKLPVLLRALWHTIDMFNVQSYFRVRSILRREKPDLVMTHNLKGVGFLTPLAIRKCGVRHLHTLHDIQLIHPSGLMIKGQESKVNSWPARIYSGICRKLFSSPAQAGRAGKPDVVISPSQWLMDFYKKRGFWKKSKCVVMPNPIIKTTCSASSLLAEQENFTFLYVGQIEKHKGMELLINAFSKLDNKDCALKIVGSGKAAEPLAKRLGRLNSNIQFLGKKSPEEVEKLMQEADCLVVPSLCYENCPTVILEAMAVGLPVIGCDIGGIPELLTGNGLVFKAGNADDLVGKIKWAMKHKDELREIGKRSVEKVKSYNTDSYIEKILKL